MIPARSSLLLLLTLPAALAAQPYAQPDLKAPTQQVKAVQSQLLAFKLESDMDEDVPAALQDQIAAFKDAFAALADAAVACAPANVDPKALEAPLAKLLDANKPEVQEVYDPKKPPQLDQIYGADLRVKVTRPQSEPQLLLVEFNFGICCGFDSVLLAYEQIGGAWKQVLRWQSPAYDSVGDAFGDFFDYAVIPGEDPNHWKVAVAHGEPWCTSRWSSFGLDLIQPTSGGVSPKVLQHIDHEFVRFEIEPTLKLVPEGFQLRLQTGMIDQLVMTRIGIFRYRVSGAHLERTQPVANNGRDFVDEWIQSAWDDASRWSAEANRAKLEQVHKKVAGLLDQKTKDHAKDLPLFTFGPVHHCTDAKPHYQVELDEEWVDDKGNSRPDSSTYFQIEEGKNSFTMLSAAASANPHCIGPDIMVKH
jgi:hypothetical protein